MKNPIRVNSLLLQQIKRDYDVDIVIASVKDASNGICNHHMLSQHSSEIEVIEGLAAIDTCTGKVIHNGDDFELQSISTTPIDVRCTLMKAEKLEAFLGSPLFVGGQCVGAVSIMSKNPRIWNDEDRNKLKEFARLVELMSAA